MTVHNDPQTIANPIHWGYLLYTGVLAVLGVWVVLRVTPTSTVSTNHPCRMMRSVS